MADTRQEHLDWCKQRALEYLDRNDPVNAIASMMSDLRKHEETAKHPGMILLTTVDSTNIEAVRKFIEDFG